MNEQEGLQRIIDILSDNAHEMCAVDGETEDIILDVNMDGVQTVAREICNVFKPAQKDMRSRRERLLDEKFERMGVKPKIYHFTKGTDPYFTGITMATVNILTKREAEHLIQQTIQKATRHSFYQPATHVLCELENVGEYGVAICDHTDSFSKRYGRNKAKGRLLQFLLKEQKK